jgi:hypothetical protein
MSAIKLNEALKSIFEINELDLIDKNIQNLLLNLEEVSDLKAFIEECKSETTKVKVAGSHRLSDWESGWSGAGVYYSEDSYNNLPYYFKNNTHVRIGHKVYKDKNGFAEVDMLRALQLVVFKKYFLEINHQIKTICEYGCGTGSNIQFLKNKINSLDFFGTDWAISACKKLIDNKILNENKVYRTDYFDPSTFFSPDCNYLAFTNASLEQSGDNYHNFMNYLIDNDKCKGGIHIEPIRELINLDYDINQQSFEYAKVRGYLNGFYNFMSNIPNINILTAKDYGIGSKYINGYQVLSWKKK